MDQLRPNSGCHFYAGLLEALVRVMGTAKGYLFSHGPRVALLGDRIANHIGVPSEECAQVFFSGVLQDLGMIGLVEDAWENPVPVLPETARSRLVDHPIRSELTVKEIPHLRALAPIVRHHHEWWNGEGYPGGLSGQGIPFGSRVLRVADTAVALSSPRPHRPAMDLEQVRDIVREGVGREFGPIEAEAFLDMGEGGGPRHFHPGVFHRATVEAVGHLIPDQVSPLSTLEFLDIVGSLIDAKDPYTAGHSRRVARLASAMVDQLCLDELTRETAWAAGYLHDLGKVGVPLGVLTKKGALTDEERQSIKDHAPDGADILGDIPALRHLSSGARYHHERWDGGGYPEGLSESRIPVVARILAVCDAYDAMTSGRVYKASRRHAEAIEEVDRSLGSHFCPEVGQAFLGLPRRVFHNLWRPENTLRGWLFRPLQVWRRGLSTAGVH